MALNLLTNLTGVTPPYEYYPVADAEAVTRGEALTLADGALTMASGATMPEFITVCDAVGDGIAKVPVLRITEYMELEAPMGAVDADPAPVELGSKLTLHTGGASLSYDTTGGVFTVSRVTNTGASGTAVAGDLVAGYFRR